MTTTTEAYAVRFNKTDGTWDVIDSDGDATFSYELRADAENCARELNDEIAVDEIKAEVEGLLYDCTDLATLRNVLAALRA